MAYPSRREEKQDLEEKERGKRRGRIRDKRKRKYGQYAQPEIDVDWQSLLPGNHHRPQ